MTTRLEPPERIDSALSGWPLLTVSALLGGVSAVLAVLLARWVTNHGGLDSPDKHGISGVRACRLGGVLIVSYILLSILYHSALTSRLVFAGSTLWVLALGLLFFAIGLFEDIKGILSARIRLLWMFISVILIFALTPDLVLKPLGVPVFDFFLSVSWLALPISLLALVFLPNAFNAADGANGLVSGTSLFVILALNQAALGDMNFLLDIAVGSCLIFLVYNVVTAKVYLGDGGAYFLGALLGGAMIICANAGALPVWYMLSSIFYPVAEFLWSIIRRTFSGQSPMAADNLHFHNLLYAKLRLLTGWPIRANTITGLGIACLFAGLPYLIWLAMGATFQWMWLYATQWAFYLCVWFALRPEGVPAPLEKSEVGQN